jgi:hypothetical protein
MGAACRWMLLPSGFKSWIYRYTFNSKAEKITLGRYPVLTLKAARERRDKPAAEVVAGQLPLQVTRTRAEKAVEAIKRCASSASATIASNWCAIAKRPTEILRYLSKANAIQSTAQVPRIELLD